ncbi:MAG TPA: hypothetical protein PKN14_02935 [Bacteroidia bacterium]|nr:hypothetical protein [Bacteroidia bacterium]MBX3104993.1 hypothetical protein [Bacteroidota bacterium]MBV6453948.1 hypothetical protein [Bacteroidia bacterium]MCB8929871.1 hypothetical protein [Bacteroidia bacterium]MCO5288156.1 hypothetical protein [Bacteroidota bacterium]
MATVIINENTKQAKDLLAFIKNFPFVKILKEDKKKGKNRYNAEFVKKIKKAEQEIEAGQTVRINPNDVWGSIGLK